MFHGEDAHVAIGIGEQLGDERLDLGRHLLKRLDDGIAQAGILAAQERQQAFHHALGFQPNERRDDGAPDTEGALHCQPIA